jgi:hypothetical protein
MSQKPEPIYRPCYGPQGQPYRILYWEKDRYDTTWAWTQDEAWRRRGELLDAGSPHVMIRGLPASRQG